MKEKRLEKRLIPSGALSMSDLYQEDAETIADISSPIEITDISSAGIGFISESELPIGHTFIADLELESDLPHIITDIRIVRSTPAGDKLYQYGAEFIAISTSVKRMLDEYEARSKGD